MGVNVCDITYDNELNPNLKNGGLLFPYEEIVLRRRPKIQESLTSILFQEFLFEMDIDIEVATNVLLNIGEHELEFNVDHELELLTGIFVLDGFDIEFGEEFLSFDFDINIGIIEAFPFSQELDYGLLFGIGRIIQFDEIDFSQESDYVTFQKVTSITFEQFESELTLFENIQMQKNISIGTEIESETESDYSFNFTIEIGPTIGGIESESEQELSLSVSANILNIEIDSETLLNAGSESDETSIYYSINVLNCEIDFEQSNDISNIRSYTNGLSQYLVRSKTNYDNILFIDSVFGSMKWFKLDQGVISENSQLLLATTFKADVVTRQVVFIVIDWCPNLVAHEINLFDNIRYIYFENANDIVEVVQYGDTPELVVEADSDEFFGSYSSLIIQ
jgi:hypothetical protein